jgi:carbonic anhydrase
MTRRPTTADQSLTTLREGNRRFTENRSTHPHQTPERRAELLAGQLPFASILTCSDSRVVPEMLFDQGLGDLFVVRIAGNVVDDAVRESLDYSVAHLDVRLIVVLGHTKCGAVTEAVSGEDRSDDTGRLMTLLRPAVEMSRGEPGDHATNAVFANIRIVVDTLRRSAPAPDRPGKHEGVQIIGAVYDIGTGRVEWLGD